MMKVKMTLNGRPYRKGDLERALRKQIEKKLPEMAKSQLGKIRCPVHGTAANVRTVGVKRVVVDGFCCEALRAEVQRHTT